VFLTWRTRMAALLQKGGLRRNDAKRFAAILIAASEGAVALSRAEKSMEPFELTAAMLLEQVEALLAR
jgi:TetR/AcrR family transcriptional repressor of lmrAB and yxaGH operons